MPLRDPLLIPSSHSILFHSTSPMFLHGASSGNAGVPNCLPGVSPPQKHPTEHRNVLQSQRKADKLGNLSGWEHRAQHPALQSHLLLQHCHPAQGGPAGGGWVQGDGERFQTLPLPPWGCREEAVAEGPPCPCRGCQGMLKPPPCSGHGRAHHVSPAAWLCGFWHMSPLRNQRLHHGSQESPGGADRAPLTRMGHPGQPLHPKAPAGPGASTAPQTPPAAATRLPAPKPSARPNWWFF